MPEELTPPSSVPAQVAPGPSEPARWWGLGDFWIAVALYLFLAFAGVGLVAAVPDTPDAQAWAVVASVALPWLGLAGWPIAATRFKGRGPVLDLRLRASPSDLALGAAAGVVGLLLAGIVAVGVEKILGDPLESSVGQLADSLGEASPWPVVVLALLAVLGAPVVEEIAFRGLLFGAEEKRGKTMVRCILVSSLLFAAFHFEPTRFVVLLVIGLVLGWVRARTASTGASIVTHMVEQPPGGIALIGLAFS